MDNDAKQTIQSTGCCELFDPATWQDKEITWENKLFVKDHVTNFLHIPLNMGKKIVANMALSEKANAKPKQPIMLADEKSMWSTDIYIDVAGNIPDPQLAMLYGTFFTKVFEGPYQNAGKWAQEMKEYVKTKGKPVKELYFFYTACPRCAEVYGKTM